MVSRDSSLGVRVGMALSLVLDVSMHTLVSGVVPRYPDAYGTGTCALRHGAMGARGEGS
jgi:hypothetical protein